MNPSCPDLHRPGQHTSSPERPAYSPDFARTSAFRTALRMTVPEGGSVLEFGSGARPLAVFATQKAARIYYVEPNSLSADVAEQRFQLAAGKARVQVARASILDFLPPEPVDLVICEPNSPALLQEPPLHALATFQANYFARFGGPLPVMAPWASQLAVQPVEHIFCQPACQTPMPHYQSSSPLLATDKPLAEPRQYAMANYRLPLPRAFDWEGVVQVQAAGRLNALRLTTRHLLTETLAEKGPFADASQVLVAPLRQAIQVQPGDGLRIRLQYATGQPIHQLMSQIEVERLTPNLLQRSA
ncbi:SAM-dependent methyltransferase [Lignipirellula cremea]|uniref:Uncharacterized protein n=1 Tax=Lignipirellula cremea TaxID=2528010 RepID=A0A518DVY8_9BACT|nr:hypothetical protein [Lignipirellula cremea]QDU96002.1 hypothetical protein Pla8534_38210 [Lignipirellula cremea]